MMVIKMTKRRGSRGELEGAYASGFVHTSQFTSSRRRQFSLMIVEIEIASVTKPCFFAIATGNALRLERQINENCEKYDSMMIIVRGQNNILLRDKL